MIWDKRRAQGPTQAAMAYTGTPFTLNRSYAEHFANAWVVLSAKYGLVTAIVAAFDPYPVQLEFPFAGLPIRKMMQATKRAIHDGQPGFDLEGRA